ncbi:MAG: polysaccharide deacetylase family protein [Pseudomonadales bacterium]
MRPRPALWRAAALLLIALAAAAAATAAEEDNPSAVVLLYHHVAEDAPATTSVTPAVFESHLDHLDSHGYQVVALSRLLAAVAGGPPLPPRAVAITFDDGYRSVLTEAAPRLAARGWPFAVFVATDYVDDGYGGYLGWDELRRLEAAGAEIGNHSRAHQHYPFRRADESAAAWRERVRADMAWAQQRLTAELARPLAAIAYPYGEFTPAVAAIARSLNLAGFGQQSGAAGVHADPTSLPRYPMAAGYADIDELASKLRTRPFRVSVRAPAAPVLDPDAAAPTLELELGGDHARLDALSCFVTGQGPPAIRWLDRARGRVAVTAAAPLPVGRSKYTCTAPADDQAGGHYWYSHLWMKPPSADTWYAD